MSLIRIARLSVVGTLLLSNVAAHAQSLGEVEQRIERLEQSVRQILRQRSESDPYRDAIRNQSGALLTLEMRFAALEKALARLTGAEELDRRTIGAAVDQIQRIKGDVETRLDLMEKSESSVTAAPTRTEPQPLAKLPPAAPTSANDRYIEARSFADGQDWVKAEFAFDTFVSLFPDDARIPEARFWLGRSYEGQGKAGQAARIFLELYEKFPKADFALDNLFALARSLTDLGPESVVQACSVYSEIHSVFSDRLTNDQRQMLLDKRLNLRCEK